MSGTNPMRKLIVRGSSMRPSFRPGTLVAVEDVRPDDVRPGNVIVFRNEHDWPVMHRVVSVRGGIVTRGDNVADSDGIVAPGRMLGRVGGRWRAGKLRAISRVEELFWLRVSHALVLGRRVLRLGGRVVVLLRTLVAFLVAGVMGVSDDEQRRPAGPVANSRIVVHEQDDGVLLFNPDSNAVESLNASAALLFGLLDGRHSPADLADCLMRHYQLDDRSAAERDVGRLLGELVRKGLLARAP
jgi:signal peptidase I